MGTGLDKENIAEGLVAGTSFIKAPSLSPKKSSRKTRSKSIGPGGLGLDEAPLKESTGNRRKSAFIPAVKSILASNDEDEKKRREARRKSLAQRRVSFAPEATLHTWDVVEYLRDATTSSSASSEATRRASSVSQAPSQASPAPDSDAEEPPSTPPEQVEEPLPGSSPANQRDLHQKKHRRSSGIPPLNFNNPDDIYSSSPASGDCSSPMRIDSSDDEGDVTGKQDSASESAESEASARLEAALRQASAYAGTQRLDLDDDGEVSMELAEEEITAAFKPWAKKTGALSSLQDQENVDPFIPSPLLQNASGEASPVDSVDDEDEEMSMDITRAIGRIVPQQLSKSPDQDDASMELTMPLGNIQMNAPKEPANRRQSLKRQHSLTQESRGSPAKRPASRRVSLRNQRAANDDSVLGDATMDFTMPLGRIQSKSNTDKNDRRESMDSSFGEETMDFTLAVGSIKSVLPPSNATTISDPDENEELSMELTRVLGGIKAFGQRLATPEKQIISKADTPKTKTPTPRKSPKKSPGPSKLSNVQTVASSPSPQKPVRATPRKSPGRPRRGIAPGPSEPQVTTPQRVEDFEPSLFVRSAAKDNVAVSTPVNQVEHEEPKVVPDDPVAAPILNRRRSSLSSVQFSPLAAGRVEQPLKSTALLSNNIKLLSTPRKQTLASPIKRGFTPKKSATPKTSTTPRKTPTPKTETPRRSISPKKRVVFGQTPPATEVEDVNDGPADDEEEFERVSLQEFLDMTNIRFMDLTTTKRRHTAAPSLFHDKEVEAQDDTLDRYVVAAACTLPEFELYQHACHEMKKFISDGRNFVRTIEANVLEENPMLFSEYLSAPPDQRVIMDNQFKNLKTNARLEARGEWYGWRSRLLQDLKVGLLHTMDGFKKDEAILAEQEKLLDAVLPPLTEQHKQLEIECKQLQQRHDELNSCDIEELEAAREQIVAADAELEEKRRLVALLQEELMEKERRIEAAKERKVECLEEIKAAERVREECRGWSTSEVNELKAKVTALEQAYGWSITSSTSSRIMMAYLNDLELNFQPSAFATGGNTPNESISLTYVGDSATPHPRPLTTSKRFFLQLIRAQLHCIPQSQTRIPDLLALVKNSWTTALAVAEGVRWLNHVYITEEFIRSDERMEVSTYMLLPTLQTKIKISFDIVVALGGGDGGTGVETRVVPSAKVVYGERYKEESMGGFLGQFVGGDVKKEEEMRIWSDGVVELGGRLVARGRKGERV